MFNTQSVILKQRPAAEVISDISRLFSMASMLVFELPFCSFAHKLSAAEQQAIITMLKEGDILLVSNKLFPQLQFVEAVMGSPQYSHAAIYEGENSVIEATTFHPSGCGVARTTINDFLSGRKNICVVRPAYPSEYNKETMFAWLQQQLGKPYDYAFSTKNDSAMYCSKLVAKAMRVAGFPIEKTRFLWCKQYLPDAFMCQSGMTTVYSKQRKMIFGKIIYFLLSISAIPVYLAGSAIVYVLWTIVFALLVIIGWLQRLKIV